MQVTLDGPFRHPEKIGHLMDALAFVMIENDDFTLMRCERLHRPIKDFSCQLTV